MKRITLAAAGLLIATPALAQVILPPPTMEDFGKPRPPHGHGVSTGVAIEAAEAALAACASQNVKVTALMVDSEGVPIALISGDGGVLTERLVASKARVALKTKMTSAEAADRAKTDAGFMAQLMADPYVGTPFQGGPAGGDGRRDCGRVRGGWCVFGRAGRKLRQGGSGENPGSSSLRTRKTANAKRDHLGPRCPKTAMPVRHSFRELTGSEFSSRPPARSGARWQARLPPRKQPVRGTRSILQRRMLLRASRIRPYSLSFEPPPLLSRSNTGIRKSASHADSVPRRADR